MVPENRVGEELARHLQKGLARRLRDPGPLQPGESHLPHAPVPACQVLPVGYRDVER